MTGAAFLKMSNMRKFSSDKRLSSQFLISHRLSKKGRASIFNSMPPLPPQQTPNKQYLSITVSKFVIEGFGLIHKQYSVPASTDLIQRKGNDKVKCLSGSQNRIFLFAAFHDQSIQNILLSLCGCVQTLVCFFVLSKLA